MTGFHDLADAALAMAIVAEMDDGDAERRCIALVTVAHDRAAVPAHAAPLPIADMAIEIVRDHALAGAVILELVAKLEATLKALYRDRPERHDVMLRTWALHAQQAKP